MTSSCSREVRRRLIVCGIVQGVGFRAATMREALRIGGLKGWVRNRASGEVEILVQGDEELVARLVLWAHHGPSSARVDDLTETNEPLGAELAPFEVRT